MNEETRAILNRPFSAELIKTRRGPGGTVLRYVEGAEYIRRLNEAFDGAWSFDVVDHSIRENEVVVLGRLEAAGMVKTSFGGQAIKRSGQTGEPFSLADDLKGAATDALKKAASLLGVGLHLYHGEGEPEGGTDGADASAPPPPPPPARREETRPASTTARGGQGGHGGGGAGPGGITERQLKAVFAIGRTLGMSPDKIREWSLSTYGCPPDELSRANASALIEEMQMRATKEAGR